MKTLQNGFRCGCIPTPREVLARLPYMPYYLRNVPKAPKTCQRTTKFKKWGMLGNNRYGCCVVSGWAHMKQAMSFVDQESLNDISEQEVIRIYLQLSPRDQGLNIDEFLQWAQQQQMPWTGGPNGVIDPGDRETMKKSIWWLGGLVLGIGVPDEWGNNPQNGFVWDRVGHFEGVVHDVQAVDYNERGLEIITWGLRGTITWEGMREQCGETHSVLAPDWYGQDSRARAVGLDVEALQAYLTEITGGPPAPDPQPGPDPNPPNPGPQPSPDPKPNGCSNLFRGVALLNQGMRLLKKDPSDQRVKTVLDWAEKYLAD